jgi:hypothetical protein
VLTTGGMRPSGMNGFTSTVFDVLEKFILSPWNVLKVECGWRGFDPLQVDAAALEALLPSIRKHIARMTDDDNARDCDAALSALIGKPIAAEAAPPKAPRAIAEAIEFDY